MMQPKERILSAIRGHSVDRTPWCPFLAYWWESRPPEQQQMGQLAYMHMLGADPMLRGFTAAWSMEQHGTSQQTITNGNLRQVTIETPVGSLVSTYTYSDSGGTWFLTGHPVKTIEDCKTLSWLYEHRTILPNSEDLNMQLNKIGDSALLVPIIGSEYKTCFQSLVEHWIGTEELCYLLSDAPDIIEDLLAVMRRLARKTVEISAESSAEAFIFWEDSSTTNISPAMFECYTAPEITDWGNILHSNGKLLIHHACGHLRGLMPLIAKLPIDALESVSPPPTGNVTIDQVREMLPEHIALIGGIEPVFFETCTMSQLEKEVQHLLCKQKPHRYVLANSDSCPPGVSEEKLYAIRQWL